MREMYEKRYSELITIPTFEERYEYLKLGGEVGRSTFGYDRYLNQRFYTSEEWKKFRRDIILRDNGCDLAMDDELYSIGGQIIVHHINPILPKDIVMHNDDILLDYENVVCVSHRTHEAIHYGNAKLLQSFATRRAGDTKLW